MWLEYIIFSEFHSVENLIVFLQHSIRFCDPVSYKMDTIVFPQWLLSLWCAADLFLQYACQMTATTNCLVCLC